MNFRFKHIRYRLLLQIVIFLIYLFAGVSIFWLSSTRIDKVKQSISATMAMRVDLNHSYVQYTNFLLRSDTDQQFVSKGENRFTREFKDNIKLVYDSVGILSKQAHLLDAWDKNPITDSLLSDLNHYRKIFDLITLAFQQRGIKNAGSIQALRSASDEILIALYPAKGTNSYDRALELKKLETEYLFASSKSSYDDMMSKIEQLSDHSDIQDKPAIDIPALDKLMGNYKSQLESLNKIILRIGNETDHQGLKAEFNQTYRKILSDFMVFQKTIYDKYSKTEHLWVIGTVLALLILSIGYIFLILQILIKIEPSVKTIQELSYRISKGRMSGKEANTILSFEFSDIKQNLIKIAEAIFSKQKFVDHLLKQKYDVDLDLTGKNDTFGKTLLALKEDMRKAREEQEHYTEDNKLRRFHNEGVAKFADILRSNSHDLGLLADIFIRELVKYLEAIQGGLFLLDEENSNVLNLSAAFAYNRKKYLNGTIKLGEGLVGSCAIEKKTVNLTEIPTDYLEITSGLGDAPPSNLLLIPVMHEEDLIGVVELASIKAFEKHQIEVGENICSSLAATIITTRNNSKTAQLLAKSQQQAAEMAEQEEEMRQNMEELKATQEESARREDELEGILNALNQSFYVIEYANDGKILNINDKVSLLFDLKSEEFIGKSHKELFGKGSRADEIFFTGIADGNTVELVEKVTINKKSLEIKNTFSPIKSKAGNTIKILNIFSVNV